MLAKTTALPVGRVLWSTTPNTLSITIMQSAFDVLPASVHCVPWPKITFAMRMLGHPLDVHVPATLTGE